MDTHWAWMAVGFLGQACFSARFVVQWLASERCRRSVLPTSFWYLSLGGGVTLLVYAAYLGDPVFIVGQAAGLLIYGRNIWLNAPPAPRSALPGSALPARMASSAPVPASGMPARVRSAQGWEPHETPGAAPSTPPSSSRPTGDALCTSAPPADTRSRRGLHQPGSARRARRSHRRPA